MNRKKYNVLLLILSGLTLLFVMIFVGFNFEEKAFSFDFYFSKSNFNFEVVFHFIASIVLFVSACFVNKTKKPMLISLALISFAEIWSFANIFKFYEGTYSYAMSAIMFNSGAILLLTCFSIFRKRIKEKLVPVKNLAVTILILYIVIIVLPGSLFDHFINISLVLYYISVYSCFAIYDKIAN